MKKIGVIINPNAKKFRTNRESIDNYLKFKSENVLVNAPNNLNELKKIISSYKSNKCEYICIAGGDGTIHLVITELINKYKPAPVPPILILKEGTMDNIAKSVHLKGRGVDLLTCLTKVIKEGKMIQTENRFTMKINNRYCFLFGTGLVTNFLNKAYSGKEKGFIRNIQVALITAKEAILNVKQGEIFQLTEQEIYIDKKKIPCNSIYGILAGTVEHVGMSFSPLINAVQKDGTFQIILLSMSPRSILANMNKLRTGKRIKAPGYLNVQGKSLLIKQNGCFEYTMDGDIYTADRKLKIITGPVINLIKI
jgi:diacylglycerol kinase family enzyme